MGSKPTPSSNLQTGSSTTQPIIIAGDSQEGCKKRVELVIAAMEYNGFHIYNMCRNQVVVKATQVYKSGLMTSVCP